MHKLRLAAAATVVALIAAFASMGQAHATTTGIGTTEATTSLLDVALGSNGSALHLRVLGDDAKATIDPAVGPVSAFSQTFAIKATSALLPALNNLSTPLAESKAPGGVSPVATPALNLSTLVPVIGPAILSGTLPSINLTSAINGGTATSGLTGKVLDNVGILGGLISVDSVTSSLGATAASASADGNRSIDVNALSVLNLGALLRGLGIDPANLPVGAISGLLTKLGVPVAGIPAGVSLESFTTTLNSTIASLTAATATTPFNALPAPLQSTLGGLNLPVEVGGVIPNPTQVTTLLTQVTGLLNGVLTTALDSLNGLNLLKLNGLKVGTVTKAAATAADSKSEVVGTLGGVSIGNLPVLSGLDLGATLGQVTSLVNSVQGTLDGVLGSISPDLAGLISVKFFDKPSTNGVSSSNGYNRSLAGITGLGVSINPPANLLGIVNGLLPASGIGAAITGAGGTVPVVGGLMGTLNGALPQASRVLGVLGGGASFKVASLATGSNFAAPVNNGAVPVTRLARTGTNTTVFLLIGMLMIAGVIVGRRFVPVRVRSNR
ncbi:MAG: hypothetical protein H0W70_09480 [Actinobacteria bacterium]|nr:hypothetical protein [Actinomycetota bacterium]